MKTKGDVIGIVSSASETVAKYTYDAWGKCTLTWASSTIGQINPFRYRGYYYDTETGLYYVSSRYYDPEIGRFINSDDAITLAFGGGKMGHNLLSYCENNPVNKVSSQQEDLYGTLATLKKETEGYAEVLGKLCSETSAYTNCHEMEGWGTEL